MASCLIAAGPNIPTMNSSNSSNIGPVIVQPPPPPMDTQRYLKAGHKVTSAVTSSSGTCLKVAPHATRKSDLLGKTEATSTSVGTSRQIKLRKQPNQPLGFSIRGGEFN